MSATALPSPCPTEPEAVKRLIVDSCNVLQRKGVSLAAVRERRLASTKELISSPVIQQRFRTVTRWLIRAAESLHPEEYPSDEAGQMYITSEKSTRVFLLAYDIEHSSSHAPMRDHFVAYPLSLETAATNLLESYQRAFDDIRTKDRNDSNWRLSAFVLRGFLSALTRYYRRYLVWIREHKRRAARQLSATTKAFDVTIRTYPAVRATPEILEAIAEHRKKITTHIGPEAATRFDQQITDAVTFASNPFVSSESHERFANLKELLTRPSNHPQKPSEPAFTQLQLLHKLALDPSWRPPMKHCDPTKPDSYTRHKDQERIFAELRWNNIHEDLSEKPPCYRRVLFELFTLTEELLKVVKVHKRSEHMSQRVRDVLDVPLIRQWAEAGSEAGRDTWAEWVALIFDVMGILVEVSDPELLDIDASKPTTVTNAPGSATGSSIGTDRPTTSTIVMRSGMSAKEARNIARQLSTEPEENSDRSAVAVAIKVRMADERAQMAATPLADRPRALTHAIEMLFAYTRHAAAVERQQHLGKLARNIYTEGREVTAYLFSKFVAKDDMELGRTRALVQRAVATAGDWVRNKEDVFVWGMILLVSPAALIQAGEPCADECTYPETMVFDVDRLDALRLEFAHLSMCSAMLAQLSAMLLSPFVQNRQEAWTSLSAYVLGTDAGDAAPDKVAMGVMSEFARVVVLTGPSPFSYTDLLHTGDRARSGVDPVHRLTWTRMRKIWFYLVQHPGSAPTDNVPGLAVLLPRIQNGAKELHNIARVNAQIHGHYYMRFIDEAKGVPVAD